MRLPAAASSYSGFAQLDSEAPPPSPTALGTEAEGTTSGSPIAPVAEDTAAEEDAQVRRFDHKTFWARFGCAT